MPENPKKPGAQPGVFNDPYASYNFKLLIGDITEGHFTHCSDMRIEVDRQEYREGGIGQTVHSLAGRVKYGSIKLKYGLTASRELWDWFMTAVKGKVQRKNISIVMLDRDGATEVLRWNLTNAWLSSWQGPPLDALSRETALEEVEVVFDGFERA